MAFSLSAVLEMPLGGLRAIQRPRLLLTVHPLTVNSRKYPIRILTDPLLQLKKTCEKKKKPTFSPDRNRATRQKSSRTHGSMNIASNSVVSSCQAELLARAVSMINLDQCVATGSTRAILAISLLSNQSTINREKRDLFPRILEILTYKRTIQE